MADLGNNIGNDIVEQPTGMEVEEVPMAPQSGQARRNGGRRAVKKVSSKRSKPRKSVRKSVRKSSKKRLSVSHRDWTHGVKGWGKVKPGSINRRRSLRDECGAKCFLKPEEHKFPVCRGLEHSKSKCIMDCRGVLAAKIRGAQWGHIDVVKKADKLAKKLGCAWLK